MSNMSYCRFENTDRDLADCEDALEALYNGEGQLSDTEFAAAVRMIERAASILHTFMESSNLDTSKLLDDIVNDLISHELVENELGEHNDEAEERS